MNKSIGGEDMFNAWRWGYCWQYITAQNTCMWIPPFTFLVLASVNLNAWESGDFCLKLKDDWDKWGVFLIGILHCSTFSSSLGAFPWREGCFHVDKVMTWLYFFFFFPLLFCPLPGCFLSMCNSYQSWREQNQMYISSNLIEIKKSYLNQINLKKKKNQ